MNPNQNPMEHTSPVELKGKYQEAVLSCLEEMEATSLNEATASAGITTIRVVRDGTEESQKLRDEAQGIVGTIRSTQGNEFLFVL